MSEENVEIVRAIFRGWDEEGVDGMLKLFSEEIVYLPVDERAPIQGHDAMRRYFERWMEPWDEFHVGPTEFLTSGDYVFNGTALRATGGASGVDVAMEYWQVWLIQGRKAARWEEYMNRTDALEAAGLSQ